MTSPIPVGYLDAIREDPARASLGIGHPLSHAAAGGPVPLSGRSVSSDDLNGGGRTQVFVGNLPYRVRWQDLKDLFRNAGGYHLNILRADVTLLPDSRSKGTGTVLFASMGDAMKAIEVYNGFNWQGRVLDVRFDTQDPTGALAIANAQNPQSQAPHMMAIPMMHFMPPGSGSPWHSPVPMPAALPGKINPEMLSTSPPKASSRPTSAGGQRPLTPNASQSESTAAQAQAAPTASIAQQLQSMVTAATLSQLSTGYPAGVTMVPVPVMMPSGPGPASAQMMALPQYGLQPGGFVYYTPQGFRPSAGIPHGYQNRHLFVGNLPFNCQWQDLKDLFRTAGNILRADITTGPDGRSRGFGTVLFASQEDAQNAVRMFNGYEFNGRQLKVHFDKFAGQQHPNAMHAQPPLPHRASAPVMPTTGTAPALQQSNSSHDIPQANGYTASHTYDMRRDGSSASGMPSHEPIPRPLSSQQAHLPSIHGAIQPPHPLTFSAASNAEPTTILGPSALMSPGPAQTGDMQAFAAAAAQYAEHQRHMHSHLPAGLAHGSSHLREATNAEDFYGRSEDPPRANGINAEMKTPDEHPGPLHVSIPPPPFFGPVSPQQARGVSMTPSMPGFSFHPFPQTPPPMLPHFLSPGLGPFSPPLGGHHSPIAYAAPGAMHYGAPGPDGSAYMPGYFPNAMAMHQAHDGYQNPAQGPEIVPSSAASDASDQTVQAPIDIPSMVSPARSDQLSTSSTSNTFAPQSALAARRSSHNSARSKIDKAALLPSALDASSPALSASSPARSPPAGPQSDGSDSLSTKVSRLELGLPANDEAQPPRRASFLEGSFASGNAGNAELRRRLDDEEQAASAPRRSSLDAGPTDGKASRLKRAFGQSIWQM